MQTSTFIILSIAYAIILLSYIIYANFDKETQATLLIGKSKLIFKISIILFPITICIIIGIFLHKILFAILDEYYENKK